MPRSRHPVLSAEALNRATLARQRLLERADLDPVTAAGELAGLQAQEPASPYLALWARLRAFAPADLDRAFRDRRLVKATLMRSTLHVVPRADYLALRPALASSLTAVARRVREGRPDDDRHARMTASALALAREPRSNTELRDHVAALAPDLPAEDAWWWVRRQAPLVHAPVDAPWSFGRRPALVDAAAWLGGEPFGTEVDGLGLIVRRHLAAFGPASAADVSAWSGLPVGRLRPAIAALEDTGLVRRFADERGRELLDLDGAPLPDPATPAPARLLPMWDGLLLAHADRTRVVSDADRASVIGVNGDTYPTLLVDGRVAGLWWVEPGDGGRPRVVLEPFRALPAGARRDLEAEGERLAAFVADVEPRVYARYRASRARRAARREHP